MKAITFDQHNTQETLLYTKEPVLTILKVHVISPDNKDWVTQVQGGTFFIKISALGKQYKELASKEHVLSLSNFIEPTHVQPVMNPDQTFEFTGDVPADCIQWKIEITLRHIIFKENDSLSVLYTEQV